MSSDNLLCHTAATKSLLDVGLGRPKLMAKQDKTWKFRELVRWFA
jgi:hypothetical protein